MSMCWCVLFVLKQERSCYFQGEDKYTFIEECPHTQSVTLLVKAPAAHTIKQIKDAIHDGLRAVNNALDDRGIVPGGGAFEVAAHCKLVDAAPSVQGRAKLGVKVRSALWL